MSRKYLTDLRLSLHPIKPAEGDTQRAAENLRSSKRTKKNLRDRLLPEVFSAAPLEPGAFRILFI
jgi:hypothetical protein